MVLAVGMVLVNGLVLFVFCIVCHASLWQGVEKADSFDCMSEESTRLSDKAGQEFFPLYYDQSIYDTDSTRLDYCIFYL